MKRLVLGILAAVALLTAAPAEADPTPSPIGPTYCYTTQTWNQWDWQNCPDKFGPPYGQGNGR
jgi:hypothetical protein